MPVQFSMSFPPAVNVSGYGVIDDVEPVRGTYMMCFKPVLEEGEGSCKVLSLQELKMRAIEINGELGLRDLQAILICSSLIGLSETHRIIFPGTILQRRDSLHVPYMDWCGAGWSRGFLSLEEGFSRLDFFLCLCSPKET
jgi:hypothetical protein